MGTESYLRVGIDGSAGEAGAKVVIRSLDDIGKAAEKNLAKIKQLTSSLSSELNNVVNSLSQQLQRLTSTLNNVKSSSDKVKDSVNKISVEANKTSKEVSTLETVTSKLGYTSNWLTSIILGVVGAFALMKVAAFSVDTALLSARYETLGVVTKVIGNNALVTSGQMAKYEDSLRKTGISAVEARQGLTRMGEAQIDFAASSKLARVAQDAAVVGNVNSSEAFNRMVTGIATGQSIILHHLGLMTNFEKAYLDAAHAAGKTTNDLTENEKAQIRVNEVLRAGIGISGSYEAAMGTAGKQLNSMKRYAQDLMVALGSMAQPALLAGVEGLTALLKGMLAHINEIKIGAMVLGSVIAGVLVGSGAQSLATWATTARVQLALLKMEMGAASVASGIFAMSLNAIKVAIASNPIGLIVTALTTAVGLWMTYVSVQKDALERNRPKDNPVLVDLREEIGLLERRITLLKTKPQLETATDAQVSELERLKQMRQFLKDTAGEGKSFRLAEVEMQIKELEKGIVKVKELRSEVKKLTAEPAKPVAVDLDKYARESKRNLEEYHRYKDALSASELERNKSARSVELEQLKYNYESDLINHRQYLEAKQALDAAASDETLKILSKKYKDATDERNAAQSALTVGSDGKLSGTMLQVEVYNKAILNQINAYKELHKAETDAIVTDLHDRLDIHKNIVHENEKLLALSEREAQLELNAISRAAKNGQIGRVDALKQQIAEYDNLLAVQKANLESVDEESDKWLGYKKSVDSTTESLERLKDELSLKDPLVAGRLALHNYAEDAKDIASQIADAFCDAFKDLEDALTSVITKGKLDFKSLADSIINDIVRMSVKQSITGPLASYLSNMPNSSNQYGMAAPGAGPQLPGSGENAAVGAVGSMGPWGAAAAAVYTVASSIISSNKAARKEAKEALQMQKTINQSILAGRQANAGEVNKSQMTQLLNEQEAKRREVYDILDKSMKFNGWEAASIINGKLDDRVAPWFREIVQWQIDKDRDTKSGAGETWRQLLALQEEDRNALISKQELTTNNLKLTEMELQGLKDTAEYKELLNKVREGELWGMDNVDKAIQRHINLLEDQKEAQEKLNNALNKSLDVSISAAQALKTIQSGELSNKSPEQLYKDLQAEFASAIKDPAKAKDLPQLGQALLSASRQYNASGAGYGADLKLVTDSLKELAGMKSDPTLAALDTQISLLEDIKQALQDNNVSALLGFDGRLASGSAVSNALRTVNGLPTTEAQQNAVTSKTIEKLEESNAQQAEIIKHLMALVNVSQAGFSQTIASLENQEKSLSSLENGATLANAI